MPDYRGGSYAPGTIDDDKPIEFTLALLPGNPADVHDPMRVIATACDYPVRGEGLRVEDAVRTLALNLRRSMRRTNE